VTRIVDSVEHPVGAAPGRADAGKFTTQLLADPARVLDQRCGDELDHGCRHGLG